MVQKGVWRCGVLYARAARGSAKFDVVRKAKQLCSVVHSLGIGQKHGEPGHVGSRYYRAALTVRRCCGRCAGRQQGLPGVQEEDGNQRGDALPLHAARLPPGARGPYRLGYG